MDILGEWGRDVIGETTKGGRVLDWRAAVVRERLEAGTCNEDCLLVVTFYRNRDLSFASLRLQQTDSTDSLTIEENFE
ncbi:hypothetical protein BH10CYA1_BH10CYA1_36100 [soil metagenome]